MKQLCKESAIAVRSIDEPPHTESGTILIYSQLESIGFGTICDIASLLHYRIPVLLSPSRCELDYLRQCGYEVHRLLSVFQYSWTSMCVIIPSVISSPPRSIFYTQSITEIGMMVIGTLYNQSRFPAVPTMLTIAGSDSCGGAGIEADIKTATVLGVYSACCITAVTYQNTRGVSGLEMVSPEGLQKQLQSVCDDIHLDAVKIGMVSSAPLIDTIAERLHFYGAKHIVVDPVMVATSGAKLLQDDAVQALTEKLLPLAEVLTPNIPEAEILSGMTIANAADMEAAARTISQRYGCAVLCKGGHQINDADDLLWRSGTGKWFKGKRIANPNTHGTGCTLSSAIASNLAKGYDLDTAVERAKAYISGCLSAMLDLGHGSGPMDHTFNLKGDFVRD